MVIVLGVGKDPKDSPGPAQELPQLGKGSLDGLCSALPVTPGDCSPILAALGVEGVIDSVADQVVAASLQIPESTVAEPMPDGRERTSGVATDLAVGGGGDSSTVNQPQSASDKKRKNMKRGVKHNIT
ncbi:hypothetical protein HOY80DRAFT_1048991 [Tuber brumale]|nr:hypothetical protein HOY80DRAFT_1048991 [Tuber brumale]